VREPGHLTAGLRHAWNTPRVRHALILLGTVSLAGTSYSVLMPVITHRLFGGGPHTLGMLLGCAGLGALLAALRLAWHGGRNPLEHQAGVAALVGGAGLLALGNTRALWIAVVILVVLGFAFTTLVASVNTVLQTNTPMALRGRTMAVFSTLFIGFNALGNLLSGTIAEQWGTGITVAGFGVICLAGGLWYRRSIAPATIRPA
jgi:MFS family permease